LWLLSSDNSSATCVAILAGHIDSVTSGISPYGAASGNQQRRHDREIVASVTQLKVSNLYGDSGGT